MSLISIYTVMPPIECFLAVIAILLFIAGAVFLIGATDVFGGNTIRNIAIGAIAVALGAMILTWNTYNPNQLRYEYLINDTAQLEQLVEQGYVPIDSEDNVYHFKKGE